MSGYNSINQELDNVEKYDGYVMAEVTNIDDPDGLDRIQVSAPGLFDNGSPWIGPKKQSPFGIGSGFGFYGVPQVGAVVAIEFQDGDPHFPMYTGSLMKKGARTDSDFHPRAWGFSDPSGNKLVFDMKAKTTSFTSSDGIKINFSAGKFSLSVPADLQATINGNLNAKVSGDATVSSDGNLNLNGSMVNINS